MSAYAVQASELLRIPGKELRALCEQDEHLSAVVIARLASVIGRRLVQLERMLAKEMECPLDLITREGEIAVQPPLLPISDR